MTTSAISERQAGMIARYFMLGHTLDYLAERGVYEGWTRDEAADVAAARGWDLDASGRVPRAQRTERPAATLSAPPAPAPAPVPAPVQAPVVSTLPAEPVRAGSVYITAVQGRELGVDHTYQRPLDDARVRRMVADWNPRMLGAVDVSDRGPDESPRYAVINGQHRAAAAAIATGLGPDVWLVCNVHEGLTVAEEAHLMHELDRRTKKLNGYDQWRARKVAGDPQVAAVERVVAAHGLRIEASASDGSMPSYGTAEKILKLGGEELLDQAIAVLRAAYDTASAAYQAPLLMAVAQLLHQVAELDVQRLTKSLAATRPEKLRATATGLRDVETGPLHSLMAAAITAAYNRTSGSGPRIAWSR